MSIDIIDAMCNTISIIIDILMKNNHCCDSSSENFLKIESAAKLLNAISEPNRIKILCVLSNEKICVCSLAERLGLAQNLVSHHLKILENVGLLYKRKDGNQIFYQIIKDEKDTVKYILKALEIL